MRKGDGMMPKARVMHGVEEGVEEETKNGGRGSG